MLCPYCQTENRDDRENCYYCEKDLTMLRLIVNKAKHHYNQALEFAERGHSEEAINELTNTLDLDGSMVNAHVVLGTLHAKKEEFEEARRCWDSALGIDHRFQKAHEYLEKARKAEYVYPAMRRLLRACALLAALLAVALAIIVILALPNQGMRQVRDALAMLAGDDIHSGDAMDKLDDVAHRLRPSREAVEMADRVGEIVQRDWRSHIDLAVEALAANNPSLAIVTLDRLQAKRPSPSIMETARKLHTQAAQALYERILAAGAAYRQGSMRFEDFEREANVLLSHVKDGEQHDEVATLLESARADEGKRLLAEARGKILEAPLDEAIAQSAEIETQHPELAEPIHQLLDQRLESETARETTAVRQALAKGTLDEIPARIEAIAQYYRKAGRPVPETKLAALRSELETRRSTAARTQALAFYEQQQWEPFLDATQKLEALAPDPVDRAKLAAMRKEALGKWAKAEWEWYQKNDYRLQSNQLKPDEAAHVVRTWQQVFDNLPSGWKSSRGALLFYAAAAHYKLGQNDEARKLIERVRSEYPKSYIIKDSMASFLERFGEKLGIKENSPSQ